MKMNRNVILLTVFAVIFFVFSNQSLASSKKKVVISAGHGWYWHEGFQEWKLQRPYLWEIVEDFVNAEMIMYLKQELSKNPSYEILPTRYITKDGNIGLTRHDAWEESAKYFIESLGVPATVWDVGSKDYYKDIDSRPLYANWVNADVLVSVHNNAGGGTGTLVLYDSINGQQKDSECLAKVLNEVVVRSIKENYNQSWNDKGIQSSNGKYGENFFAEMPSVIIEVAFMDQETPDNEALHDERFKKLVASAIKEGIDKFFHECVEGGSNEEDDDTNQSCDPPVGFFPDCVRTEVSDKFYDAWTANGSASGAGLPFDDGAGIFVHDWWKRPLTCLEPDSLCLQNFNQGTYGNNAIFLYKRFKK